MSWPQFLNPAFAAAAGAIAAAALVALYFLKLRRQERKVSTTLLWKKTIQDLQVNTPFQRLRRNLLLLLQLLLLILLAVALSRPIVSHMPRAGGMTVILIDRSASMSAVDVNGKSRLDEAKRRAKDLVGTLSRGAMAMVIAFDDSARAVQPFTSDAAALRRAIDSIEPSDRRTRLKLAYQLAEAQSDSEQLHAHGQPDVWLFSDGRAAEENLSLRGNLTYVPIGTELAANVAVAALSARRHYERPTEVAVFARLANFGPEPVTADVQLRVNGVVKSVAGVWLLPERWTDAQRAEAEKQAGKPAVGSVEFKLELTDAAVLRVEHTLRDGDVLAADNAASLVVPPPRPLRALLVTDGRNFFLEKAVTSLNLQQPATMTPAEYEAKKPRDFDVVIFDRFAPAALPDAGNFLFFGAVPPMQRLKAAQTGGRTSMLTDVMVLDWKRDHPMLRHLSLGKLYVAEAIKLLPALETEILVDGIKTPLVVLHREGRMTSVVAAFDLLQSNWPLKVSFPVFLNNTLQFLAVGSEMDVRQSFSPGDTPRISQVNLQKMGELPQSLTLHGPGGERKLSVPPAGDLTLPALERVGIYEVVPPVPGVSRFAVNLLDENESDLRPLAKAPGNLTAQVIGPQGKRPLELWWWIVAAAALPLLIIEWWVYTRRVHL